MRDEIDEEVEDLRFHGHRLAVPAKLEPIRIHLDSAEHPQHRDSLPPLRSCCRDGVRFARIGAKSPGNPRVVTKVRAT
jgi:hypothetical protein